MNEHLTFLIFLERKRFGISRNDWQAAARERPTARIENRISRGRAGKNHRNGKLRNSIHFCKLFCLLKNVNFVKQVNQLRYEINLKDNLLKSFIDSEAEDLSLDDQDETIQKKKL